MKDTILSAVAKAIAIVKPKLDEGWSIYNVDFTEKGAWVRTWYQCQDTIVESHLVLWEDLTL